MKRQIIIEFDDEDVMKCPNGPDGESGVLSITPDEVKTIYKNCYKVAELMWSVLPKSNSSEQTIYNTESLLKRFSKIEDCILDISSTMHDVEERNQS